MGTHTGVVIDAGIVEACLGRVRVSSAALLEARPDAQAHKKVFQHPRLRFISSGVLDRQVQSA